MKELDEVIFLASEFPPMHGGIGSQAFNIYKELSKNNNNNKPQKENTPESVGSYSGSNFSTF